MGATKYDVVGIGNAIVDILAKVDDAFLTDHDLTKGAMMLVDADRALELSGKLTDSQVRSGGSAGNTIAGLQALGASTAFFGKLADDDMGDRYHADMTSLGVHFPATKRAESTPTAQSIIVIAPDGERTMNTYLGACTEIGPEDIDEDVVKASSIVYFEGYLWDPPMAKDALRHAAEIAHAQGNKVSITLSDAFCVDRYRDEFLELIKDGTVDLLFANEQELLSLYEMDDFDAAIEKIAADCPLAAVTRSEKGAVIVRGDERVLCDPYPVSEVIDTTGAGDMFAAGFLYGYSQGWSLHDCGRLGCLLASNIIQVVGPRLEQDLKEIAREAGFGV